MNIVTFIKTALKISYAAMLGTDKAIIVPANFDTDMIADIIKDYNSSFRLTESDADILDGRKVIVISNMED